MARTSACALLFAFALVLPACRQETHDPPATPVEPILSVSPPVHPPPAPVVPLVAPVTSIDAGPAVGTRLERARQEALNGHPSEVRSLLQPASRAGGASPEEARLLKEACKQMKDEDCLDELKAKRR